MPPGRKTVDLSAISDEELLNSRVCDLPLTIEGTWLADCIGKLYGELQERGLQFRPVCYLADEWLTPTDETCIGIPFYLAHPRLIELEKRMMLEAEGETEPWCLRLLRHETGHAIGYAYRLQRKTGWKKFFGNPAKEYPETHRFRPYSKNYVQHLENFYAQFHPDEDFVETFAVWLTPGLDWRAHYKGWGALRKLEYIDTLMREIQGKAPVVKSANRYWRLSTLRLTLKSFYARKKQFWAEDLPDFHDANLRRMFEPFSDPAGDPSIKEIGRWQVASQVLEKYREELLTQISRWTGERKYVVDDLLKKVIRRSRELNLVTAQPEPRAVASIASYLTTLVMNYQYTGRLRGKKRKR